MSKIVVELEDGVNEGDAKADIQGFGENQAPKKREKFLKTLRILVGFFLIMSFLGGIGGFGYWQYLKTTPQYSLALLVDAAKRDDQKAIDELIDMDKTIDDFVPQIIENAIELYGRGLEPTLIQQISLVATPFLPVVKRRARAELPNLIREKTKGFEKYPFWVLAVGANRYLEFERDGDIATITSKIPEQEFNIKMKRNGNRWQIVGVKDEKLAKRIAQKIGEEMINLVKTRSKDSIEELGRGVGIPNLGEIIKKTENIFK